jgi:hypothetical protein
MPDWHDWWGRGDVTDSGIPIFGTRQMGNGNPIFGSFRGGKCAIGDVPGVQHFPDG